MPRFFTEIYFGFTAQAFGNFVQSVMGALHAQSAGSGATGSGESDLLALFGRVRTADVRRRRRSRNVSQGL